MKFELNVKYHNYTLHSFSFKKFCSEKAAWKWYEKKAMKVLGANRNCISVIVRKNNEI